MDAIISDILMPDGDGIWLVKELTRMKISIPIFFITAGCDVSRTQAIGMGVRDLFRKPLDMAKLEEALKNVWIEQELCLY